jgi:hypothetical protein
VAGAATTRARNGRTFSERWLQALAAHLQKTEFADRTELNASTVLSQGIAQTVLYITAIA